MNTPSISERLRYWFDNWMSKGTIALMVLLGIATLVLVLAVFGLVSVFTMFGAYPNGDPTTSPADTLWGNLMRTLDPGTMGADTGWTYRILMLIITIGGLIIVASLIGIVSGAFDAKIEELRKGRSKVLEDGHTLILGWNAKVFSIINEICVANESQGRSVIVVLGDKPKVEMEDEIRAQVPRTGRTKVICRSGDPMSLVDLEISNPHTARSVILLAPDGSSDPDSDVIKTALALTNNPQRKKGNYHIVGEIEDESNLEAAHLVGRDEAHWLVVADLIGRITVQSSRQSCMSVVYASLLTFEGAEIYFTQQPTLHGKTYFQTQLAFPACSVFGMVKGDEVFLNPEVGTVFEPGDQLIVIAEDDSTISLGTEGVVDATAIVAAPVPSPVPERTLVLGYHAGLHGMLAKLDQYVAPGSAVTVVADIQPAAFDTLDNLEVVFRAGDATSRAVLDSLAVETYDHIIVLAYRDTLDKQRADGKTLVTLLQLRSFEERTGVDLSIVSEMLDDRNRELAEVTNADDYIVSDKLGSLLMSQFSENKKLTEVFAILLSAGGSEIYLRPAEHYVAPGASVDFYTVLEAARRRGETAIGYRVAAQAHASAEGYGVHMNPGKADTIRLVAGDKVIVVAES